MVGFAADGDTRMLSAMKNEMKLGMEQQHKQKPSYVQDPIHIGTKGRNRLLKHSSLLPMGNKQASQSHLKILINVAPKDVHGLVLKDICPDDRQNFGSLEKVMQPRVLKALHDYVPDSEATVMYLKLLSEVTSSYMDNEITPLERIKRIWHAIFFLRIWRKSLMKSKTTRKEAADCFITENAYTCIEINGQSMLNLMKKFRDESIENEFLITYFHSQSCEGSFRQFRSMTTINWTKINFSILELTHLVGRVELLNDIIYFKLKDVGIEFPRAQLIEKQKIFPLPSDDEIDETIEMAMQCALDDAIKFGLKASPSDIRSCELPDIDLSIEANEEEKNDERCFSTTTQFDFNADEDAQLSGVLSDVLCLKDYSEMTEVGKNSRFTKITDKQGTTKTVRKSSVVWLLSNTKESLSSDRLQRVKNSSLKKPSARHLNFSDLRETFNQKRVIFISDQLCIGQWSIFKIPLNAKVKKNSTTNQINGCVVGCITGFKYSNGKNEKERQYSWDFASIENHNIQVSATWYFIDRFGTLFAPNINNTFFIDVTNYVGHMMQPCFDKENAHTKSNVYISEQNLNILKESLLKILS